MTRFVLYQKLFKIDEIFFSISNCSLNQLKKQAENDRKQSTMTIRKFDQSFIQKFVTFWDTPIANINFVSYSQVNNPSLTTSRNIVQNPPWDHIPEFVEAKKIVRGIMAVNDPAERLCATAKKYKVKRETNLVK